MELIVHGLELQPAIADLARANITRNKMDERMEVTTGDVAYLPGPMLFIYDHVLMNPPFHDAAKSDPSPDESKRISMMGEAEDLSIWIVSAARCLKLAGTLTMIMRADRLDEVLGMMKPYFGDASIIPLLPKFGDVAKRVIVQARKGEGATPIRCRPLILHRSSGGYSDETEAILKHNRPITFIPA